MTATLVDRNTPYRDGELIPAPVAAGEHIPAGVIVCINAHGYAVNGKEATDLIYAGRAEDAVDNSAGQDGDLFILLRRGKLFLWENDGTLTQAHLGRRAYILDNQTVSASDGRSAVQEMPVEDAATQSGAKDERLNSGTGQVTNASPDDPGGSDTAATRSVAGTVMLLDADGVWIY